MNTAGGPIKLVAMADVFEDKLQRAYRTIKGQHNDKVEVPEDQKFVGFDAFKQLLQTNCDVVILATPPGFRPLHFAAAIAAGKVPTDEAQAMEWAGYRPRLVAGRADNIKVTTAEDLALAGAILGLRGETR